ncbi:putative serine hydrolase [Lycorma delicatula]|uniref:putative serine hydrolase n=1 Tax=Lycorma delicatula TaxID=130591 RepID=UPI003F512653
MEMLAKEVEIPVPWGVIKGKWWGSDKIQPVLAVHGWQDNLGTFDTLAPLLSPEISLLCVDLPGHGLSSHYPKGMAYYLFWDTLILIRRIAKHYKWEKISILGHSLGGAAGFLYAAIYPNDIDKLISIDVACPRVAKTDVLIKQAADCIDKSLKYEKLDDSCTPQYTYDEMIKVALDGHHGSLTRESCEILMERGMAPLDDGSGKLKFSRDPRLKVSGLAMFAYDEVLTYASKIKCEYLNIRGVPGLKFEIPELYEHCLDKIKESAAKFEYHKIPGTHHVHLNDPSAVAGIINEFLRPSKNLNSLNTISNNHEDLVV